MKILRNTLIMAIAVASTPVLAGQLYKLRVDGLACAYCAYGVEKQFMRTPGVEHVDIDFENGYVLVSTDDATVFSENQLRTIVNDAGFTLRGLSVESTDHGS